MQDSQGQILALTFKVGVLETFRFPPCSLGSGSKVWGEVSRHQSYLTQRVFNVALQVDSHTNQLIVDFY